MPDVSSHWAELLTPALTEAFTIGFADRPASLIPSVFGVRGSERAYEQFIGTGVLSSKGWQFDGPNGLGRVRYDDRNKGYASTFTHREFASGFVVERKLVDDNQSGQAFDDASALGDAAFRTRERSGASVLNNAFTSTTNEDGYSTLGPDAVVLCSASHPYSSDQSGSVQSNTGTSALSDANVSATRVAMMKFTDDRGDIMDVMPDTLIVPPELEDTALKVTKSLLEPTSANNAVNPQAGRFGTLVWHYLTDANNWFMTESSRQKRSLLWFDRIGLEFAREQDFDTLQARFRAYMRYSYGWRDWAWIYGHNVT